MPVEPHPVRHGAAIIVVVALIGALLGACATSSNSGTEYTHAMETLLARAFEPKLTAEQAHCAAPKIAGIVGTSGFHAHNLTPTNVSDAKAISDLHLDLDAAHAASVVSALFDCINLGSITVTAAQAASPTVHVDAAAQHCLAVQLSADPDFRAAFVADFTSDSAASAKGGLALLRAFGTCKVLLFDEAAYTDAMSSVFAQQNALSVTDVQAKCLAAGFVHVLTVARLERNGITPNNIADSTAIAAVRAQLSTAEVDQVGALFATCIDLRTTLRTVFASQLASTHPTAAFIDCVATHAANDPQLRSLIARTLLGDTSADLASLGVRLGAQYRTQCG